jgi:integrase
MNTKTQLLPSQKIEEGTAGLTSQYVGRLKNKVSEDNALAISDFILSAKSEINLSDNCRKLIITVLGQLSAFHKQRLFTDLSREDVLSYLNSLRKLEASDPLHRWIGTYNNYLIVITKFFKWLYSPHIEPKKRPKPNVVENIPKLKRKEESTYKPSDLWSKDDDLLFLKYCPNKRDRCYHAMARDTSCRPHELLKLRIKDIIFKISGNHQYAQILVNGKTGSRPIPLIDSIPYVKDWLDHGHPHPSNPNGVFICGLGKRIGRTILTTSLAGIYSQYKDDFFPKAIREPKHSSRRQAENQRIVKETMEPIYSPPFCTYRKINYAQGICFETTCGLVWKISNALEVYSLFWQ